MKPLILIPVLAVLASAAPAKTPKCPPAGIAVEVQDYIETVTIVQACLGTPEEIGQALAAITNRAMASDARLDSDTARRALAKAFEDRLLNAATD